MYIQVLIILMFKSLNSIVLQTNMITSLYISKTNNVCNTLFG